MNGKLKILIYLSFLFSFSGVVNAKDLKEDDINLIDKFEKTSENNYLLEGYDKVESTMTIRHNSELYCPINIGYSKNDTHYLESGDVKIFTISTKDLKLRNEDVHENVIDVYNKETKNVIINLGTKDNPIENIDISGVKQFNRQGLIQFLQSKDSQININAKNILIESKGEDPRTSDDYNGQKHVKGSNRNLLTFYGNVGDEVNNNQINIEAKDKITLNGDIGSGYSHNYYASPLVVGVNNTININQDKDNTPNVKITGAVQAGNLYNQENIYSKNNRINIRLNTKDSFLKGIVKDWKYREETLSENEGVHLELSNGAKWYLDNASYYNIEDKIYETKRNSGINYLTLNKDSEVIFDHNDNKFKKLYVYGELNTSDNLGGIITLNIDASKRDETDSIKITGVHKGIHYIKLNNVGNGDDGAAGTGLVYVENEQGEFKAYDNEDGIFFEKYELAKYVNSNPKKWNNIWYLKKIDITNIITPIVEKMDKILPYKYYILSGYDTLNKRIGSINKFDENKNKIFARIKNNNSNDIELGYSRSIGNDFDMGYSFLYGKVKNFKKYEGDVKVVKMFDNGIYLDSGLGVGQLNLDDDIQSKNAFLRLNLETGYKKEFKDGISLIPEAQLIYTKIFGTNYMVKKINVQEKDIDSLIGRIGINIDKKWNNNISSYFKFDVLNEFKANQNILLKKGNKGFSLSKDFYNTWIEYGVGVSGTIKDNLKLNLELSKDTLKGVNGNLKFNLGLGYTFK